MLGARKVDSLAATFVAMTENEWAACLVLYEVAPWADTMADVLVDGTIDI